MTPVTVTVIYDQGIMLEVWQWVLIGYVINLAVGGLLGMLWGMNGDWEAGWRAFRLAILLPLIIVFGPFILIYKRLTLQKEE